MKKRRSSYPEVFCKKAVLMNIAKSEGNMYDGDLFLVTLQAQA